MGRNGVGKIIISMVVEWFDVHEDSIACHHEKYASMND